MNSLRTTLSQFGSAILGRKSTVNPALPNVYQQEAHQQHAIGGRKVADAFFKPKDIRTYPRMAVLAATLTFCTSMTLYGLWYISAYFSPKHRKEIVKEKNEHRPVSVTRSLSKGPILMHGEKFQTLGKEGLGVNHDKWAEQKRDEKS